MNINNIEWIYFYNGYVIVSYNLVEKDLFIVYYREEYNSNRGVFYFTVKDIVKDINYPNVFIRKIRNSIFNIISDKIISFEVRRKLIYITNKDK